MSNTVNDRQPTFGRHFWPTVDHRHPPDDHRFTVLPSTLPTSFMGGGYHPNCGMMRKIPNTVRHTFTDHYSQQALLDRHFMSQTDIYTQHCSAVQSVHSVNPAYPHQLSAPIPVNVPISHVHGAVLGRRRAAVGGWSSVSGPRTAGQEYPTRYDLQIHQYPSVRHWLAGLHGGQHTSVPMGNKQAFSQV